MINVSFYLIRREKRLLLQGLQVDLKQATQILTDQKNQNQKSDPAFRVQFILVFVLI